MPQKVERREGILIVLCSLVYFFNYFCRYNFAACLASMVDGLGTTQTLISIALTGNAITYGAGQAICGILGDKISPRYFISIGLVGSALCNFIIGLVSAVPAIWVLWAINGIVQAMIWPALVRVMTEQLSRRAYMIAAPAVSYACNISTFIVYLCLVPLCLNFATWRMAFIIPAVLTALMGLLWFILLPRLSKNSSASSEAQKLPALEAQSGFLRAFFRAGMPFVLICVLLQGILRDGVQEWMPSLIQDTYHLADDSAVMTAAILPAFSIICVFITITIYKKLQNEQLAAFFLWGASAVGAVVLFLFRNSDTALVAIVAMAFVNGSMHGINHLLTGRISPYFAKYNRVSTVTGIINCFPYIGSAVAAPLAGALGEGGDWTPVFLLWLIVACAGVLLTALHLKRYTKFIHEDKEEPTV